MAENDSRASLPAIRVSNTNTGPPAYSPQSRPITHRGFDRSSNGDGTSSTGTGIVQPKPQALPKRSGPASIIVSPRQKGNPILEGIKSIPWEYGDIPADFQLGLTTCALFLSLQYHRLHPEYVYNRIRALQGKYLLRIVLVRVDIESHQESIKELTKTSVINNVTIILCWSVAEGARYLENFKAFENAAPTPIKQHQSNTYTDRMVDFITTPRAIKKPDAVSLVSQFGTIHTAVNARDEDVAMIAGWGEKKVQQWCTSVRQPFRVERAGKRAIDLEKLNLTESQPVSRAPTLSRDVTLAERETSTSSMAISRGEVSSDFSKPNIIANESEDHPELNPDQEVSIDAGNIYGSDEEMRRELPTLKATVADNNSEMSVDPRQKRKIQEDPLTDGVMAALSKLRKPG